MVVFGSLLIAATSSGTARADEAQAPPMLTPQTAADVAAACPEAQTFAHALVRGITLAQAAAATLPLSRCAGATRLPQFQWKNANAGLALAAVELSQGVLTRDPANFKRAAAATRYMRDQSAATDSEIRGWDQLPDAFDLLHRQEIVYSGDACAGDIYENAAYLNLAAQSGKAWIVTPRVIPSGCIGGPAASIARVPVPPYAVPQPAAPDQLPNTTAGP